MAKFNFEGISPDVSSCVCDLELAAVVVMSLAGSTVQERRSTDNYQPFKGKYSIIRIL